MRAAQATTSRTLGSLACPPGRQVQRGLLALFAIGAVTAACARHPPETPVRVVDLLKQIGHAETRPLGASIQIGEHTFDGRSRASLVVPVPSRITLTQALPVRGVLRVDAAVPDDAGPAVVLFRIGISDDRVYEALVERQIASGDSSRQGWTPMSVDLSGYAGRKFSLFYRPDNRRWRIVFGVYAVSGASGSVYWGAPGIDTDVDAAKRYVKQHSVPQR